VSGPDGAEWFTSYFDERVIRLYEARQDPGETRREVGVLLNLMGLPLGARVLDVGCGWGRHAFLMAEAGFDVTGVEISAPALALIRMREGRGEVPGARGAPARWVRADMRALPFRAGFEGAVSLGSSLGYFGTDEGDLAVLRGMRRALHPGGCLVIETMHRGAFEAGVDERERWDDHEGEAVEVERSFDPRTGINRERITWPDGTVKSHAMLLRTESEWDALLREAGFAPELALGGWEGEPVEDASPVLILVGSRTDGSG